jgi:hypothetical protein
VGKPCHALEFRDMAFQSVITGVAFEPHVLMRFAGNTAALLFLYYIVMQREAGLRRHKVAGGTLRSEDNSWIRIGLYTSIAMVKITTR